MMEYNVSPHPRKYFSRCECVAYLRRIPHLRQLRGKFFGILDDLAKAEHDPSAEYGSPADYRNMALPSEDSFYVAIDLKRNTVDYTRITYNGWQAYHMPKARNPAMVERGNYSYRAQTYDLLAWDLKEVEQYLLHCFPATCEICGAQGRPWTLFDKLVCPDCDNAARVVIKAIGYSAYSSENVLPPAMYEHVELAVLACHIAAARMPAGRQTAHAAARHLLVDGLPVFLRKNGWGTLEEAAQAHGIRPATVRARLTKGQTPAQAFMPVKRTATLNP